MEPEFFDWHASADGGSLEYSVLGPNGSVKELSIPRRRLGVIFTVNGPIELSDDEDNERFHTDS